MNLSDYQEQAQATTHPPIWIVPPVISSSPAIDRNTVDLPQPDGPTSTMNSPARCLAGMRRTCQPAAPSWLGRPS